MSKSDAIQMDGIVEDIASNAFKVKLTNGAYIRATLAGKLLESTTSDSAW